MGICYHPDMQKELDKYAVSKLHTWVGIDANTRLLDIPCTCRGENQPAAKKIIPTGSNTKPIVVYNNCARTLHAATMRQIRQVPGYEKNKMLRFQKFCKRIFDNEILPILENFDYNLNEWYNHLSAKKQLEVDIYFEFGVVIDTEIVYCMFCKREKQIVDGTIPKNRAISAPGANLKFVLGPVVWALEEHFKKLKGYCGGKNWGELEKLYASRYADGFHSTIQGDGSAFDSTQNHEMKYIDRLIYNWLSDNGKIHHVNPDTFKDMATKRFRTLVAKYFLDGKVYTLGKAKIDATVTSGNPDTTFGNTLRMSLICRFMMEEAGYDDSQFDLDCKGDDFAIFTTHINDRIKGVFDEYWVNSSLTTSNDVEHGLGIVLKFLVVGGYEDLDFCSTNVIHTRDNKFKIVRQLNRMNPLSHWSTGALGYSDPEFKQYLLDQAQSLDCWASGMPFYSDYANTFRKMAERLQCKPKMVNTGGKPRKIKPTNSKDGRLIGKGPKLYEQYGRDFAYGHEMRQSDFRPDNSDVYRFLGQRYNLTPNEISVQAERVLKTHIYDLTTR